MSLSAHATLESPQRAPAQQQSSAPRVDAATAPITIWYDGELIESGRLALEFRDLCSHASSSLVDAPQDLLEVLFIFRATVNEDEISSGHLQDFNPGHHPRRGLHSQRQEWRSFRPASG